MKTPATNTRKYRLRWWTLAVISLTVLIVAIDTSILNVALPTLQRELGASASELQWLVNSYILVFAGLLLTMGGLGDRFGRQHMFRGGVFVFGLSSLATMPQLDNWQDLVYAARTRRSTHLGGGGNHELLVGSDNCYGHKGAIFDLPQTEEGHVLALA